MNTVGCHLFVMALFVLALTACKDDKRLTAEKTRQQNDTKLIPKTKALFCEEPIWNIGEINTTNGISLTHEFQLKNISPDPIEIEKIDSSCGCLLTDNYERIIPRGGTITLGCSITLDPFPGQITKFLFVQTKGEKPDILQLTILARASLNPMLHSYPEKVDFGLISPGEKQVRDITIKRYDNTPVLFKKLSNLDEHPEFELLEAKEENNSVLLRVSLDSSGIPNGDYLSSLHVITDHEKYPDLKVPLQAMIKNAEDLFTPVIFINRLGNNETKTFPIWKHKESEEKYSIKHFSFVGDEVLHVMLLDKDEKGEEKISISRAGQPGSDGARIAKGKILIQYQNAKEKQNKNAVISVSAFLPKL